MVKQIPDGVRFERDGDFLIEQAGAAGKIERVNFQETGSGVAKSETGVVVMNYFFERRDDAAEKFVKIACGDEDVVDVEKHLQPVAFAGELNLIGLRSLEIERVIDGNRDLAAHALHELKFRIRDELRNEPSKSHGAEPMLRGGERNHRQRAHADFAQAL